MSPVKTPPLEIVKSNGPGRRILWKAVDMHLDAGARRAMGRPRRGSESVHGPERRGENGGNCGKDGTGVGPGAVGLLSPSSPQTVES
jgi:hypothetical protein